jgi:hypothetical protein
MYNVFVSHAWDYSERYEGVLKLLKTATISLQWFSFRDYSVPKHAPLVDPDAAVRIAKLRALLKAQISHASCVIVPAGMYVNNRFWIQAELDIARSGFLYAKPVIGIRRRSQLRTPVELEQQVDEMVNWNSTSLAEAIRRAVG